MKTIGAVWSFSLLIIGNLDAQHITNIFPQAVGDKVIIRYDIEEAKEDQVFEVALYYSQDQFSQSLRSVSGNGVGTAVGSGQERVIIWDVLKDVDQFTGEFSFEVRALVKSKSDELILASKLTNRNVAVTNKDEAYPEIAQTLSDFINEAKDIKDAFQFLGVQAMESRQALSRLSEAVEEYNRAFEKLNNERLTYEKYVTSFWKRDVLALEFKNVMDYALGDLHSINILTLNQKLSKINDVANGRVKKPGEVKKELTKDIGQEVIRLDKQLQELERRANRVLYNLNQD